jgi:hypothetical protein
MQMWKQIHAYRLLREMRIFHMWRDTVTNIEAFCRPFLLSLITLLHCFKNFELRMQYLWSLCGAFGSF